VALRGDDEALSGDSWLLPCPLLRRAQYAGRPRTGRAKKATAMFGRQPPEVRSLASVQERRSGERLVYILRSRMLRTQPSVCRTFARQGSSLLPEEKIGAGALTLGGHAGGRRPVKGS